MNKIKNVFIRAVSGILLSAIYIFIVYIADNYYIPYFSENLFCVCIAGIITSIWYFLSMKILKLEYKKISDYIPSAVSFCVICLGMYAIDLTSISEINIIYSLGLYVVVNCLFYFVFYLIHAGKERRCMLLKRIVSTVILYAMYSLIILGGFSIGDFSTGPIIVIFAPGVAVIITLIFYFITTKYYKISYDVWGLITTIVIFMILHLIFWRLIPAKTDWYFIFALISCFVYAFIGLASFVIIWICRYIKREMQDDEGYQQSAEDLSSDEEEEKDITGENELTNGSEPYINNNLQKVVLENMKSFLLKSGNDFILIDEEYHLQAGKDVYYPDLLLYHMKLQCFMSLNLETDDFKPEYLDRMNAYLETLDRDFKKPTDNPSMGIFLCKNEGTEVVEYSLNKGLSREMKDEYEAKLIDKKILKEKLGELYDRARETN